MLEQLNNYDWKEVFNYCGEATGSQPMGLPEPAFPGCVVSVAPVTREDVVRIIGMVDGENDGPDWVGCFELKGGRFMAIRAGCDYTGWDCRAGGTAVVANTEQEIIKSGKLWNSVTNRRNKNVA